MSFPTSQGFLSFESVFVLILTYGHETFLMDERRLSKMQVAEMGFLQSSWCVIHNRVCSCEISKVLNVEPLLLVERSQLRWLGHVSRMFQKRLAVLLATPTGKQPRCFPRTSWHDYIPDVAWYHLGVSQLNYRELLMAVINFESS